MNSFDVFSFLQEYSVPFATEGKKHTRPNWVNTPCPFCSGTEGFHLGCNLDSGAWYCWRCGKKDRLDVVMSLSGLSRREALSVIYEHSEKSPLLRTPLSLNEKPVARRKPKTIPMPFGTEESLSKMAVGFLKKRNYDPSELVSIWGIKSTGPMGNYKYRIVIPYKRRGDTFSYQSRDYTGKRTPKYMACPKEEEAIPHKSVLYGMEYVRSPSVVLVEGPFDVWRVGRGRAVCGSGVELTPAQINILSKYKKVYGWFDPDKAGQRQIEEVAERVQELGRTEFLVIPGTDRDPADMTNNEVKLILHGL